MLSGVGVASFVALGVELTRAAAGGAFASSARSSVQACAVPAGGLQQESAFTRWTLGRRCLRIVEGSFSACSLKQRLKPRPSGLTWELTSSWEEAADGW